MLKRFFGPRKNDLACLRPWRRESIDFSALWTLGRLEMVSLRAFGLRYATTFVGASKKDLASRKPWRREGPGGSILLS